MEGRLIISVYFKFTAECASERILKIGHKVVAKIWWLTFLNIL